MAVIHRSLKYSCKNLYRRISKYMVPDLYVTMCMRSLIYMKIILGMETLTRFLLSNTSLFLVQKLKEY